MTHPQHPGPAGHERRDAHAGDTFRAGLYILATMFLVALLLVPMYRLLGREEARSQRPAATVLRPEAAAPVPAFPKLVTSEPLALAAFRAQEDALLTSWGWVEKDRGIARMPVAEAMRIVAGRGALPGFPAPGPSPAPAGDAR
jgi:hypothetical protein